ncbi:MAG TPA: FAD:protein FMN transferase, partial [Nitrososphaera sp.]|nr:FAD:protein FMN transferase [Nitrososphaera sp.]
MRQRAFIMGMPVILDIPGRSDNEIFQSVFHELHRVDEQFSPFIGDSELSRLRRGEIGPDSISGVMKNIIKACREAEAMTDGFFSARYGRGFDPTGYVKGWAIAKASRRLLGEKIGVFSLSVGGDINAYSNGEKTWKIGILDPLHKKSIVGKIVGKNLAIATSGNYERGNHIINPKTRRPARELLSLTVEGPDIIKADILATAAYVMGKEGIEFIDKEQPGYEVL